jgi:hypothetical protein
MIYGSLYSVYIFERVLSKKNGSCNVLRTFRGGAQVSILLSFAILKTVFCQNTNISHPKFLGNCTYCTYCTSLQRDGRSSTRDEL